MPGTPEISRRLAPWLLAALGVLFAGYLAWLIDQRLDGGDVYPPYSSMRADPLGCKALYLAVDAMPDRRAMRNVRQWHRFTPEPGSTIFMPGTADQYEHLPVKEKEAMLAWIDQGHRVVLTLPPRLEFLGRGREKTPDEEEREARENEKEEARKMAKTKDGASPENGDKEHQKSDGGCDGATCPTDGTGDESIRKEALESGLLGLEWKGYGSGDKAHPLVSDRFPGGVWRGDRRLVLPENGGGWTVEGTALGKVAIASRKIGAGEIIVVSDTSFASNEAVWSDRRSAFLLALLGDAPVVVFDERLLGTVESPGLVSLVRRLGLHGLLSGGILMLILLIWQGICPLVPPRAELETGKDNAGRTRGRDATEGLVSLLRRGLPPSRLLDEGITRWIATRDAARMPPPEDMLRARDLARQCQTGTLPSTYSAIRRILNPPKNRPPANHGNH